MWCSAPELLCVTAEFVTHGGKQLIPKGRFAARAETFVERGRKHRRRHGHVDCGFDRPSPFPGVGDLAGEIRKCGILSQRRCGEVEQP